MNLPNKLTVVRMVLIPVFAALFLIKAIPCNYIISAVVFAAACFTDYLDGHIARKNNLVTTLGSFLDPIADKLLVSTALILLLTVDFMPVTVTAICVALIIARELAISAFRQVAAKSGVVMSADYFGKIKTVFQDFAILILLVSFNLSGTFFNVVWWIGFVLLLIATVLTVLSAINYLVKNKAVLK